MKTTRRKQFQKFAEEFATLCQDWHGVYSERDTICPEDGEKAFLFQTRFGTLCASIHAPMDYKREEILPGSIYMKFHTYSGPTHGPGRGEFNQFSHKWNIHYSGDAMGAREAALMELYRRFSTLGITKPETTTE